MSLDRILVSHDKNELLLFRFIFQLHIFKVTVGKENENQKLKKLNKLIELINRRKTK